MAVTAPAHITYGVEATPPANDTGQDPLITPRHATRRYSPDILQMMGDVLRLVDFFALVGVGCLCLALSRPQPGVNPAQLENIFLVAILVILILHWSGSYEPSSLPSQRRAVAAAAYGSAGIAVMLPSIEIATGTFHVSALPGYTLWLGCCGLTLLAPRCLLVRAIDVMVRRGVMRDVVAIVGAGPLADRLATYLTTLHSTDAKRCPIEVVGIFDDRHDRLPEGSRAVSGTLDDLVALGREGQFDRVVLTLPWSAERRLVELRDKLQALAIDVSLCPGEIAFAPSPGPHTAADAPAFFPLAERPFGRWAAVAKRLEDIVLALLALLLLGPLMCFVALAVKLDSPGPALFRQRRHGLNNREIEVFKFRTMRIDAADQSGGLQACRGDARVTRVGSLLRRSSLDELPQLLNVLRGDMSMVGPRPHPVGMRTEGKLCHEIVATYAHRHRVRPGITGWAQVNGYRGATCQAQDVVRRVEYDLFYIENWSILFDLKIILRTPTSLVTTENAF